MTLVNYDRFNAVLLMSKQHQAQLVQMINSMLADTETNIALIQQYVLHNNTNELQHLLHKLRGGYATLGAEQLANLSKTLELTIETGNNGQQLAISPFIHVYRQTGVAIRAALSQFQANAITTDISLALADIQTTSTISQLFTLLQQQDMHAVALCHANQAALAHLLTPLAAVKFNRFISELNFAEAATLLQLFVATGPKAKTDD